MFNKTALSWQMQYETRWCIKQHSHLFYYTWKRKYMGPSTLSEPLPAHSEQWEGVDAEVTAPRADRKGKHPGARVSSLCRPFPGRTETTATSEVPGTRCVHVFGQSFSSPVRKNSCSRPWPFPGSPYNQAAFKQLIDVFKKCMKLL